MNDIEEKLKLGTASNEDIINLLYHTQEAEIDLLVENGEKCQECNSTEILNDNEKGYKVCTNCGSILGELFNKEGEWRNYCDDNGKNNIRCNFLTNMLLPQSTLGTSIGGKQHTLMKKLHVWSAVPYKERKNMKVYKKIEKKCRLNKIPGCIEDDAKILYKNVSEAKYIKETELDTIMILRGSNETGLIAACIYYACKKKGYNYSINEMRIMFNISKPKMTNGCKLFKQLLKAKKMEYSTNNNEPSHYIGRILKNLAMEKYSEECIKISKNIDKLNISTQHTPLSTAAATVLLVSESHQLNITPEAISKVTGLSKTTVEKAYITIFQFKKILANDSYVEKLLLKVHKNSDLYAMPQDYKDRYENLINNYDSYIDEEEDEIMYNNPNNYTKKLKIEKDNKKKYALIYKKL